MTLEDLYHQHHERVFNLALNYLQNIEDAEEVTQDVFVKVHEKLSTFRGVAAAGTWIYRITVNTALDALRARHADKRSHWLRAVSIGNKPLEQDPGSMLHPGINLEHREALQQLFSAINNLPVKQRTAIILLKVESLSLEETAQVMQISKQALESLYQRAKTQLKNKLAQAKDDITKSV